MNDFRFALRQLRKSPGFTFIAVLTLALGIGANTAIFSVVNAVLLKPLPFPAAQQLVALGSTNRVEESRRDSLNSLSYPDYFDFRKENQTLANSAVYHQENVAFSGTSGAQSLVGIKASGEFFDVLGVQPLLGHGFVRADEQAGGGPGGYKVVLGYDFWQKQFGGDKSLLGRTIQLDRRPYTVIGIMPAHFQFPIQSDAVDLYTTIAEDASNAEGFKPSTEQRGSHSVVGVARLKPGVSLAQAQADLSTIAARLEKQYPDTNTNFGVLLKPLREEMVGDVRTALYCTFRRRHLRASNRKCERRQPPARARLGPRERDRPPRRARREPRAHR